MTQSAPSGSQALTAFFATLAHRGVAYCVVGNTMGLPRIPENDVDIVCAPDTLATVRDIIRDIAARHGGRVAQVLRHESGAFYYVVYLPQADSDGVYLKLDICGDYVIGGRLYLSAAWLLEGRAANAEGFCVAATAREFAYYLLKKVAKGRAEAPALQHLAALWAADREGCRAILNRYWPPDRASLIERAISAGDWSSVAKDLAAIRADLDRRLPARSWGLAWAEMGRRVGRMLWPTGFVVAVLGPDGAGKGTLIANLLPRIAPLGRSVARYHLMPPVMGGQNGGAVVDQPHAKTPRGAALSTLKLLYFALAYNLGWLCTVWLARRRSSLVLFDRYYHDLLADPRRYRNGAPAWIVRAIGRIVPTPDMFLVLDVEPWVARARKTEVSAEESSRQFAAYRALCAELRNAHLIDANRSPHEVTVQCERAIAEAMADRLERRTRRASAP